MGYIKEKLKGMLFVITTLLVFLAGLFGARALGKRKEKKAIRKYYDERREKHDLLLKLKHRHIDSTPVELQLGEGEYLREKPNKNGS